MPLGIGPGEIDGRDLIASLQRHRIPLTRVNYAVWAEYHAAPSSLLRRAVDILLSNGRLLDDGVLAGLYERFCTPSEKRLALVEAIGDLETQAIELTQAAEAGDVAPLASLTRLIAGINELHDLLDGLGRRLGFSMDWVELLERTLDETRREATQDSLTGIANRRAFDTAVRTMAGDAMNSGDELSLLILDVDHFKRVNDRWGHDTGDQVLRMVGHAMRQAVRGQDFVARFGGEEFAVLLPATPLAGAIAVAEHVREAVAGQRLPLADSGITIGVTVSVGVAAYDPGEALAAWVGRADAALYRAKQRGRNRVACAPLAGSGGAYEATA